MKITHIIIHHAGGTDANPLQDSSNYTVQMCNRDHKRFDMLSSLGWYVGYQYFIDKQGVVTKCREDTEEGAHTIGQNKSSIGICLAGNFDATLPTEAQKTALKALLEKKMKEWNIPIQNIVPHRKFAVKTCFGRKLPDDFAQKLVTVPTTKADTVTPLLSKLVFQIGNKQYKEARDTCSYLFNELTKV